MRRVTPVSPGSTASIEGPLPRSVIATFRNRQVPWDEHVKALHTLTSTAHDINEREDDGISRAAFLEQVGSLSSHLAHLIYDLRSALVKEVCQCTQSLVEILGAEFVMAVGDDVIPALLSRSCITKAVIRDSSVDAAQAMFEHGVNGVSIVTARELSRSVLDRKLPHSRRAAAAQFIGMILVKDCLPGLEIIGEAVEDAIAGGCQDPDESVRAISRENWRRLEDLNETRARGMLTRVSPQVTALILKEKGSSPRTSPRSQMNDAGGREGASIKAAVPRRTNPQRANPSSTRLDSGSNSPRSPIKQKPTVAPTPFKPAQRLGRFRPPPAPTGVDERSGAVVKKRAPLPPRPTKRTIPVDSRAHLVTSRAQKPKRLVLTRPPRRSVAPNTVFNSESLWAQPLGGSRKNARRSVPITTMPVLSQDDIGVSTESKAPISPAAPDKKASVSPAAGDAVKQIEQKSSGPGRGETTRMRRKSLSSVPIEAVKAVERKSLSPPTRNAINVLGRKSLSPVANESSRTTQQGFSVSDLVGGVENKTGDGNSDGVIDQEPSSETSSPGIVMSGKSIADSVGATIETTNDLAQASAAVSEKETGVEGAVSEQEKAGVDGTGSEQENAVVDAAGSEQEKPRSLPGTPQHIRDNLRKARISYILGSNVSPDEYGHQKKLIEGASSISGATLGAKSESSGVEDLTKGVEDHDCVESQTQDESSTVDPCADVLGSLGKETSEDDIALLLNVGSISGENADAVKASEISTDGVKKETRSWEALVEDLESTIVLTPEENSAEEDGVHSSEERTGSVVVKGKQEYQRGKENERPHGDKARESGTRDQGIVRGGERAGLMKPALPHLATSGDAMTAKTTTRPHRPPKAVKPALPQAAGHAATAKTTTRPLRPPNATKAVRLKVGGPRRSIMPGTRINISQSASVGYGAKNNAGSSGQGDVTGHARLVGPTTVVKRKAVSQEVQGVIDWLRRANRTKQTGWQERCQVLSGFGEACKKLQGERVGVRLAEDCVAMLGDYMQETHHRVVSSALDGLFFLLLCSEGSSQALQRALERRDDVLRRMLGLLRSSRENERLAAGRVVQSFEVQFRPEVEVGLLMRALASSGGPDSRRVARASASGVTDARVAEMGSDQLAKAFERAAASGEGFLWKTALLEAVLRGVARMKKDRRIGVRRGADRVINAVQQSLPEKAFEMACDKYGVQLNEE